jgi:hypothetical protein
MAALPRFDQLGPDPEPLGARAELLLERIEAEQVARRRSKRPKVCCLSQAIGKPVNCSEARCPYFRVPGTHQACAVDEWSPRARYEPRIAGWFIARRNEIARGRAHPSKGGAARRSELA